MHKSQLDTLMNYHKGNISVTTTQVRNRTLVALQKHLSHPLPVSPSTCSQGNHYPDFECHELVVAICKFYVSGFILYVFFVSGFFCSTFFLRFIIHIVLYGCS